MKSLSPRRLDRFYANNTDRGLALSTAILWAAVQPGGAGVLCRPDNINYVGDVTNSALQDDFSHPVCAIAGIDNVSAVSAALPGDRVLR